MKLIPVEKNNHFTNEQLNRHSFHFLLKNQDQQIIGGISAYTHKSLATIDHFWIKASYRGYSCGSLLLGILMNQLKHHSIDVVRIGTHLPYVKQIMDNNQFTLIKNYHSRGIRFYFYEYQLSTFSSFDFNHPLFVILNPTEADLNDFYALSHTELHQYFGRELLVSIYLDISYKGDLTSVIHAYQTNDFF